jgi:hypothetical protein
LLSGGPPAEAGSKDPNQMCCCTESAHKGGRIGSFMEHKFAPLLVKTPVLAGVVLVFVAFCGLCAWQTSELKVQDTQRSPVFLCRLSIFCLIVRISFIAFWVGHPAQLAHGPC